MDHQKNTHSHCVSLFILFRMELIDPRSRKRKTSSDHLFFRWPHCKIAAFHVGLSQNEVRPVRLDCGALLRCKNRHINGEIHMISIDLKICHAITFLHINSFSLP